MTSITNGWNNVYPQYGFNTNLLQQASTPQQQTSAPINFAGRQKDEENKGIGVLGWTTIGAIGLAAVDLVFFHGSHLKGIWNWGKGLFGKGGNFTKSGLAKTAENKTARDQLAKEIWAKRHANNATRKAMSKAGLNADALKALNKSEVDAAKKVVAEAEKTAKGTGKTAGSATAKETAKKVITPAEKEAQKTLNSLLEKQRSLKNEIASITKQHTEAHGKTKKRLFAQLSAKNNELVSLKTQIQIAGKNVGKVAQEAEIKAAQKAAQQAIAAQPIEPVITEIESTFGKINPQLVAREKILINYRKINDFASRLSKIDNVRAFQLGEIAKLKAENKRIINLFEQYHTIQGDAQRINAWKKLEFFS